MGTCTLWFLLALVALMGTVQSQEITGLYSNLESADVTIDGDAAGCVLQMQLLFGEAVLQTRSLALDGPGTWAISWSRFEAEEGSYRVCARLLKNGTEVSQKCYDFYYGGVSALRFDVRDFYADSRGMHIAISSSDPTIVDIYYMLLSGGKAVYVDQERAVSISGSFATPFQVNYAWKHILEKGREYEGRVKIVELNHNQTRAFMNSFVASEDARISDTYQDETGASATVVGNSRVPFEGRLRFVLSQNGTETDVVEKRAPVLLTDDDETVEVSWNKTLAPGVYHLRTELIGGDGEIKDVEENLIDAKVTAKINSSEPERQNKSPMPSGLAAAALIMCALLLRKKKS
ncbi:MAG TPA: hypothetical protein VLY86_01635 [Methanothrix sp.]|nr:hypothetical protein [Methanothrix sp.]